jgi:hypothetical protein
VRKQFHNNYPVGLDYGIYWIGPNSTYERATGKPSRFYDPRKPTIFFLHGWQGAGVGTVYSCRRPSSYCTVVEDRVELFSIWFENGWNVGMFMWDQFADEECIRDAEYKLWRKPARWLSNDCNGPDYVGKVKFRDFTGDAASVSELCANSMQKEMKDFSGSEVRFLGHSLGAQLAAKCAELLHTRKSKLAPSRVTMLEPAFSHIGWAGAIQCGPLMKLVHMGGPEQVANSSMFGEIARKEANEALKSLIDSGVVVELVQTTKGALQFVACSSPVLYHSVYIQYHPSWCPHNLKAIFNFGQKGAPGCAHDSVVCLYLLSLKNLPNANQTRGLSTSSVCSSPSAATPTKELQQVSKICKGHGNPYYVQSEGTHTFTTIDDKFTLRFRPPLHELDSIPSNAKLYDRDGEGFGTWLAFGASMSIIVAMVLRRSRLPRNSSRECCTYPRTASSEHGEEEIMRDEADEAIE